ncbi:MAG TPA: SPOR domain-containing protein [Candidatus Methylomirabilis sp.]|nr:SPOR domain-containing protein [Candidatus Methylomirabilis sp.]
MRTLRHKLGFRRGDPERHSFAFFVMGTLVVIAVAFFLGFQLGRYVEKDAGKEPGGKPGLRGTPRDNTSRIAASAEIRKDLSAFSTEASNVPAVAPPMAAPPTAGDELKKTESEATFPEALSRKDPSPEPMAKKKGKPPASSGEKTFHLQAGAMKSLETAEAVRKRLDRGGYKARVIRTANRKHGELYRVRVGPFGTREEALKAMKAIRAGMRIDVILVKG